MPVVVIAPRDQHYEKTLSNLQEVRAREGQVIAVVTEGDETIGKWTSDLLFVPAVADWVAPLLTCLPLQLLAYYIADLKGTDVDQPRNLAKTVTVE
jgi:glucosamine--fructose-6-phosphate aminotransferase (isomerizing)